MRSSGLFMGVAAVVLTLASPADALTFVLNNTGGAEAGTQARLGFDIATRYWSSVLTDDVTVTLNIGYQPGNPGNLGLTNVNRVSVAASQVYGALASDQTTALDRQAVSNLRPLGVSAVNPGYGAVSAVTNALNPAGNGYVDTAMRFDNDGSYNNSVLSIAQSSARALGILANVAGSAIGSTLADASITFNSNAMFDFDPTDGIAAGRLDFLTTAIHEIGHALGFNSGVQNYDARTAPEGPNQRAGTLENTATASSLDLFRYGADGTLDWSTQGSPYFSIDGGASPLFGNSSFATGEYNGDGNQPQHWKDNPRGTLPLGIMDPNSMRGQSKDVTALDLAAFDAIGWNANVDVLADPDYRFTTADAYRAFAGTVPEPATWLEMVLGFALLGGALRYWRPRLTATIAR